MADHWKSTPKYWCKHCSTYVKDTPFERRQHESTGKHQGNLKRSLRDIQNNHERNEREKQKAKAEVERLNRVVGGGGTDAGTTSSSTTSTTAGPPSVRKSNATPQSAADKKRQWAQLANMGIQVPDEFRAEMAMAGNWTTVAQHPSDEPQAEDPLSVGIRKRKLEGPEDVQDGEEIADHLIRKSGWGSTTRQYPGHGHQDLDDLLGGKINIQKEKMQVKSESKPLTKAIPQLEPNDGANGSNNGDALTTDSGHDTASETLVKADGFSAGDDTIPVKTDTADEESQPTIRQIPEANALPVFKKRKAKKGV